MVKNNDELYEKISITGAIVGAKLFERYFVAKQTSADTRKYIRAGIALIGSGVGIYDAYKGANIPNWLSEALMALGGVNVAELVAGPENVVGLTGGLSPEELEITKPDISRIRSRIGDLTTENLELRERIGAMAPEELVELSPVGDEVGIYGDSADMMRAMGTLM